MSAGWVPRPLSGNGQAMKPVGQAPITPDVPFNVDAYEAMIAVMDEMIAQAGEVQGTEPTGDGLERGRS